MKVFNKQTTGDMVRLIVFCVITALATGLLAITIGNVTFGKSREYKAEFVDVTGLNTGDDIRIAGVKVGSVKDIEITDRTRATVTFSVDASQQLDLGTHATIRYRNLIGQRYIALTDQFSGGSQMHDDQTIPVSQTQPALDLSTLFNGFKPLFQALSPSDVNKLSYEIIQVFQGEGGTLDSLLAHTASLTSTLADRDKVIDDLIDNLNEVLDHLGDRDKQLSHLIVTFKRFVGGLAKDRNALLDPLNHISQLSVQAAGLVTDIKAPLLEDLHQLKIFSGKVNRDKIPLANVLQLQPIKLTKIGRTASYKSWFNFYLCDLHARVEAPGGLNLPVEYNPHQARCNLG